MSKRIGHRELESIVINKKSFFINLISTMLEKKINDILMTPKFNFNKQEIDFLVFTNLGDIVLFELKTINDINSIDMALAQINRYTSNLLSTSADVILLKIKETNAEYEKFLSKNNITKETFEKYIFVNLIMDKIIKFIILPAFSKMFLNRFNDLTKGMDNIALININEKTDFADTCFCYKKFISDNKTVIINDFKKLDNYLTCKVTEPLLKQIERLNLIYNKMLIEEQAKDNLLQKLVKKYENNNNINNEDVNDEISKEIFVDKNKIIPKLNISIGELLDTIKQEYLKCGKITVSAFIKKIERKELNEKIPTKYTLTNIFNTTIGKILVLSGIDPEVVYSNRPSNKEQKEIR